MLSGVLKRGQLICGRWERHSYRVVRLLGQGGTGSAYLVQNSDGLRRAMKISGDPLEITREHRMLLYLNRFNPGEAATKVPRVYELDDFQTGSEVYHYMITEYCPGTGLDKYIGRMKAWDVARVGSQIATLLSCLHREGLIFGDLKPGNIICDFRHNLTYLVDFGSVTIRGVGLKQYTPCYDRASWRAGSRLADEKYDIFALGMLLIALLVGKPKRDKESLEEVISRASRRIKPDLLWKTIAAALSQDNMTCGQIAANLQAIMEDIFSKEVDWTVGATVNLLGAVSVITFILGLAYYY